MTPHSKQYGSASGPLGFPMLDKQAFALEALLRTLPAEDRQLARVATAKAPSELLDGERADVSWITTEDIDREGDLVVSRGMNDSQFKANPMVTLQHCYYLPPVGRSLWRKRVKDGPTVGVKAKTQYPARPDDWPEPDWQPDVVFSLIKAGLLQGKSIGFVRLKSHAPSSQEIAARPELAAVNRIIDEWLLLEYAVTFLPTNQAALVEAVSKGSVTLSSSLQDALGVRELPPLPQPAPEVIPFTSMEEIQRQVEIALGKTDWQLLAATLASDAVDRSRGRI
jgi:hypothetical protein